MSSSLASHSKQQQLRTLAAATAAASASTRITDKLAKYDAQGNLSCAICKVAVVQSQWQSHTSSTSHQQTLESLRELARKKAAAAGAPVSTPAGAKPAVRAPLSTTAAPSTSSSSLSSGTVTSSTTVINKLAPTPSAVSAVTVASAPASSPLLGLGAYEDDEDEEAGMNESKQAPSKPTVSAAPATAPSDEPDSSFLPTDFFDAGVAPAPIEEEPTVANESDATAATGSAQQNAVGSAAPVPIKSSNAFMIGASATHNPAVAGKLPAAAPSSASKSLSLASSLPAPTKSTFSTTASRKDLSSEHAAFEAMLRDTAIESEKQSKLDSLKLAKLRKLDEQEQSASYGDRLSNLKRAREEAKKKLEEQRAAKRTKLPAEADSSDASNANPSASTSTPSLGDDEESNPFLDWRAQGSHR